MIHLTAHEVLEPVTHELKHVVSSQEFLNRVCGVALHAILDTTHNQHRADFIQEIWTHYNDVQ